MSDEAKREIPAQIKELHAYIDTLFEQLDSAITARRRHMKLELGTLLVYLVAVFLAPGTISAFALLLFWFTFIYGMVFLSPKVGETASEIDGCFKTLEILGFIEKNPFRGKRKRPTLEDLFAPLVRSWQSLKDKMQREAYGQGVPSPVAASTYATSRNF